MKLADYLREAVEQALDTDLLAFALANAIEDRIDYTELAEELASRISDDEIKEAAMEALERALPF